MDRVEMNVAADANGEVVVRVHVGAPGAIVHVVIDTVSDGITDAFERAAQIFRAKGITDDDVTAEVGAARAERGTA